MFLWSRKTRGVTVRLIHTPDDEPWVSAFWIASAIARKSDNSSLGGKAGIDGGRARPGITSFKYRKLT